MKAQAHCPFIKSGEQMIIKSWYKPIYFLLGIIFTLLAIIGIVLPLVPTTPFALLAVFFFSRSSPRFHLMLLKSPIIGRAILDWEVNQVIRPKAKISACLLLLASIIVIWLKSQIPVVGKGLVSLCLTGVGVFLVTRSSYPKQDLDNIGE